MQLFGPPLSPIRRRLAAILEPGEEIVHVAMCAFPDRTGIGLGERVVVTDRRLVVIAAGARDPVLGVVEGAAEAVAPEQAVSVWFGDLTEARVAESALRGDGSALGTCWAVVVRFRGGRRHGIALEPAHARSVAAAIHPRLNTAGLRRTGATDVAGPQPPPSDDGGAPEWFRQVVLMTLVVVGCLGLEVLMAVVQD